MKVASVLFFSLLVYAHANDDLDRLLGQPLSLFRDEKQAWLGYGLFWSLFLVGIAQTLILIRSFRQDEACVAGLATLLLLAVATTDSYGGVHLLCSLLLLLVLFSYYAFLLFRANSFWFFGHLFVPIVLGLATRLHSYGIWQKGFIVYFVLVCTVHHHLLARQLAGQRKRRKKRLKKQVKVGLVWRQAGQT